MAIAPRQYLSVYLNITLGLKEQHGAISSCEFHAQSHHPFTPSLLTLQIPTKNNEAQLSVDKAIRGDADAVFDSVSGKIDCCTRKEQKVNQAVEEMDQEVAVGDLGGATLRVLARSGDVGMLGMSM